MIRFLILIVTFLKISIAYSGSLEEVFYFESSKEELTQKSELKKLVNFQYLLKKFKIDSVYITGFADKDGNRNHNLNLSKKRAIGIKKTLDFSDSIYVSINWKGDDFIEYENDSLLKYKNRKVTVRVIYSKKITKPVYFEGKLVRKGDELNLPSVRFVPGKAILLPGGKVILNEIAEILKYNPSLHFLVEGHVCCQHDVELSENRAKMVYEYLVDKGIDKTRLKYFGYGIAKLKYPQNDGRNRRVALKVLRI